jgi:hypothetical protein
MSAFCVYAATIWMARARAEKKTPSADLGQGVRRVLALQEWNAKVDEKTQRIFQRMKHVRASPLFDAPQFCVDWIALAEKSGPIRDAQVMAWQVDKYSDDQPVYDAKGRPKRAWLPYRDSRLERLVPNPQAMAMRKTA